MAVLLCGAIGNAELHSPPRSGNRPPLFVEGASTTRRIAENSPAGQEILPPVSATDSDGHRLTYRLDGNDAALFLLHPRDGRLRTQSGVTYDHEARDRYAVTIRANDGHGASAVITVGIEVTDELEPPSAPDAPTVTAATRDALTVRWTPPANTGPDIRDYEGRYGVAGSGTFEGSWERVGADTQETIDGLTGDTAYEVQVRAKNAEGTSGWSASLEARTEANQAPAFAEGQAVTRRLEENTAADVSVGLPVMATDADQDMLAYSLERPDESPFTVDPESGQLRTKGGVTYDYETQPAHTVTMKAEDGHGGSATAIVTVSLTNMRDAVTADAGWDLTVVAGGTAWLDGTASSTDAGEMTYSWALQSWPGDSQPSLDNPASPTPSFSAAVEGTYLVRLSVTNGIETDTDEVRVTARASTEATALVAADLLVDTNRDGVVDSSDEAGEDTWSEASGAVFGPNADDDDEDGIRDGWDARVNGDADLLDMAPVVVRQIPGLHRNHSVVLEMTHAATSNGPQLFYEHADGGFTRLIAGSDRQAELPLRQLVAGDLRLHVDSPYGRNVGFDGQVSLTLTVRDGSATTSEDTVALQGAPILFSHHLQPAERVFVSEIPDDRWIHNNKALVNALDAHLPAATELYRINYTSYRDRWVQDFMQTGYSQNESETPAVHTRLHRLRALQRFLPNDYLGPDAGYASPGGEYYSRFNSGGNVEIIPPHTQDGTTYPFGRIVIGGRSMAQRQIDFFNAQGVQGPAIVVATSWLYVSHVDEIFSVLPNHNVASEERSWVIAIGSPALAVELLEEAVERGFGDAPIFAGHVAETTANELLADTGLMSLNDTAQAKIDTVRDQLITEVGLAEDDFREVPALFDEETNGGLVALVPSIQNALVVDDVLFVADPEGPVVDGTDIWRQAALDALEGLGLTTHFVDVYYSYHYLLGAIHCATNVERAAPSAAWWEGAESEDSQ